MKIRTETLSFEKVAALPRPKEKKPKRPNLFFRSLVRLLSEKELKEVDFSYTDSLPPGMKDRPCLILMNHSCFLDLSIVSKLFFPRPYCIVTTSDGFVGKEWLMRNLGCIPTRKFVTDYSLVGQMKCALTEKKTSVLMYPEASYTFDGCQTPLPRHLGFLFKRLGVPVVMIRTFGAFARDPLYNGLKKRKVKVSALLSCLATAEEVAEKSVAELDAITEAAFSFDSFAWQKENGVEITESFRADGLERILFRCPDCEKEGCLKGEGTKLFCTSCGSEYELEPLGNLKKKGGEARFPHIPDWYQWERECVKKELAEATYRLDAEVDIGVMRDYKAIYLVGSGRLVHDENGFCLTGDDGKLVYRQKPIASYGLYSDYFWYEIGDVICIGDGEMLYYCFPKHGEPVAKVRLAAEELYKMRHREIDRTPAKPAAK